jgi:hypothetical protein
MAETTLKDYWIPSFDALYDAYFYELASDHIIETWYWIDLALSLLTAVMVLASAVIGWELWTKPNGKIAWGCFAVTAFALTIFHRLLSVPSRIRKEGERRQVFSMLRVELQNFRSGLPQSSNVSQANKRFDLLQDRLRSGIAKTPQDIVFTERARRTVQVMVNEKLRKLING